MRDAIPIVLLLAVALPVFAHDLGSSCPPKAANHIVPPPSDPAVLRQGGDTIADAVMVTLPVVDLIGTTAGYTDDYDQPCPWSSLSPDVVYTFVAAGTMLINLDLLGSTYDTKIYVFDENLALIGCNDDFYPDYTSKIEGMPMESGVQYFIVIDGFGGDFGDYLLNIDEYVPPPPCILDCPDGAELENEPPLVNDYVDNWNGGCNTDGVPPFQPITHWYFCGVSGFYNVGLYDYRDTDWFEITIPDTGELPITGDAELDTWIFELGPQDCETVGVVQQAVIGPCNEGSMTIVGEPGSIVWFWVGPQDFASPDGSDVYEYDYILIVGYPPTHTENHTWTDVKSLFD